MNSFNIRLRITVALVLAASMSNPASGEPPDAADLPAPITSTTHQEEDSIDNLGEGPVKPVPYRWQKDDAVTPTSHPTIFPFLAIVDDVDPNNLLERPGIPVGWFSEVELTAANPRVSSRQQSGSLLNGTFADPVAVPFTPLDWTVMPKVTVGHQRQDGIGSLSASYRFLFSQGSQSNSLYGPGSYGSSRLLVHVLDLDWTVSDLFPTDLFLVPRQIRVTGGVRVAGISDKASQSGGDILGQSASNTFVGAGPRFALETLYPIASNRNLTLFGNVDAAGLLGSDWQTFDQTVSGPDQTIAKGSANSPHRTVTVPVVGLRTGVNWLPDWGSGNVKMSAGFQWERWFYLGTGNDSLNELTILGPFVRGEMRF